MHMQKAGSVSEALSRLVSGQIKKNQGLGRIFNYVRKLESFKYMSDFGIFRFIVIEFRKTEKDLSEKTINYHFNKRVNKDDYEGVSKKEILRDLYTSTS